jgi:hypothetical protein
MCCPDHGGQDESTVVDKATLRMEFINSVGVKKRGARSSVVLECAIFVWHVNMFVASVAQVGIEQVESSPVSPLSASLSCPTAKAKAASLFIPLIACCIIFQISDCSCTKKVNESEASLLFVSCFENFKLLL